MELDGPLTDSAVAETPTHPIFPVLWMRVPMVQRIVFQREALRPSLIIVIFLVTWVTHFGYEDM